MQCVKQLSVAVYNSTVRKLPILDPSDLGGGEPVSYRLYATTAGYKVFNKLVSSYITNSMNLMQFAKHDNRNFMKNDTQND